MANTLYDIARQKFLKGELNWESGSFKVCLVNKNIYTPNFSSHVNLSDVSASAIPVPGGGMTTGYTGGVALVNKTATAGAADADDVTFTAVDAGRADMEALLIYFDSGNASTNTLIALIDSATGLPIQPNGGDIIVVWDSGVNKIFRL